MKNGTKGLVIVPKKNGELGIPKPLMTNNLKSLIGNQVAIFVSPGHPEVLESNRRAGSPAITFISMVTPRKDRLHHMGTFLPQGHELEGLLREEYWAMIDGVGKVMLPESALNIFTTMGNTRARVILLTRKKGDFTDGFALSFQKRFPVGSNGQV